MSEDARSSDRQRSGEGTTGDDTPSADAGTREVDAETSETDDGAVPNPMDAGEGGEVEHDPTAVFDALGDETRLAIVQELADRRRKGYDWTGATFSELRKAVGVRDAGRFNYHLDKLVGTFVVKDGDEYVLTTGGMEVAGAVRAGTYTDHRTFEVETDQRCPGCDRQVHAQYRSGTLLMTCPEHGVIFGNNIPGGAVAGRDPETVVALSDQKALHDVERAMQGACVHCWGEMSATTPVAPPPEQLPDDIDRDDLADEGGAHEYPQVLARFDCADCGMQMWIPVSGCIVSHPAVVAFHHERGVDIREQGYLDYAFMTGENGTVVSEDPVRVRVDVELDGDRLAVVLDETVAVVEVREA